MSATTCSTGNRLATIGAFTVIMFAFFALGFVLLVECGPGPGTIVISVFLLLLEVSNREKGLAHVWWATPFFATMFGLMNAYITFAHYPTRIGGHPILSSLGWGVFTALGIYLASRLAKRAELGSFPDPDNG